MKVIVCGGRDFADAAMMERVLNDVHSDTPISLLIEGGAKGADRLARLWAIARSVPHKTYPAAWHIYREAAGPMRNEAMLKAERPHLVIAFSGGRGTADMVRRAQTAGVPVVTR